MLVGYRLLSLQHSQIHIVSGYLRRHAHHSRYIISLRCTVSGLLSLDILRYFPEDIYLPTHIGSKTIKIAVDPGGAPAFISGRCLKRGIISRFSLLHGQAGYLSTPGSLIKIEIIVYAH